MLLQCFRKYCDKLCHWKKILLQNFNGPGTGNPGRASKLTHWGWDKIAVTLQTTFSNAFYWMKMFEFELNFHWSLFPRVQLTAISIHLGNGLAPNRWQAITWNNVDHDLCPLMASLTPMSQFRPCFPPAAAHCGDLHQWRGGPSCQAGPQACRGGAQWTGAGDLPMALPSEHRHHEDLADWLHRWTAGVQLITGW